VVDRQERLTRLVDEKDNYQRDGKANQHLDETEAVGRRSFSENTKVSHPTITSFHSISINRLGILDMPYPLGEDSRCAAGHGRSTVLVASRRVGFRVCRMTSI